MNLENEIIELLKQSLPLKAKDIAIRLGNDLSAKDINLVLYRNLKGKVVQDSNYRWSLNLGESNRVTDDKFPERQDTILAKLASYYLECISKDIDTGISEFASSKYGNLDYAQLKSIPIIDSENNIQDLGSIANFINKVRREKQRLVLKLGYPIFLRKFISKAGNPYYKVEPVFLITIDTEQFFDNSNISFSDEDPQLNPEMLRNILGVTSSELLQELLILNEELGINNTDSRPTLDDLAQRLEQIRSDWEWIGEINPYSLSSVNLSQSNVHGIHNSCGLFISERSQYTIGLEKELTELSQLPKSEYIDSALGDWIQNSIAPTSIISETLLEPLSLNEEQREAILKGLSSSLTVVTGPPGTGKSQVVASLLINSVFKGQKVLFASKNHKAVDVVYERVNGLTTRPVMLRIGNTEFQAALSSYLTNLLSSKTTYTDNQQFDELKARHDKLSKKIFDIRKRQEDLIACRNKVDQLEQSVEKIRDQIGQESFENLKALESYQITDVRNFLEEFELKIIKADKRKQPFIVKLFWSAFNKARYEETQKAYSEFQSRFQIFRLKFPDLQMEDSNTSAFYNAVQNGYKWLLIFEKVIEYFEELNRLKRMESLYQLSLKDSFLTDEISDNSLELWQSWLQLIPETLSGRDRKTIGDYVTLLNLIVKADTVNQKPDRGIWSKYYKLLPEITHILSCWAVTSLSVRSRIPFSAGFFDLVVIDEASQCDIASALPLLFRAKRAVIIGDDKQLTHISAVNESQDIQLLEKYELDDEFMGWSYAGTSLFRLATSLCNSDDIVVLRDHHRSHAHIINYSNKYFYQSNLRIATKYENLRLLNKEQIVRWINISGKVRKPSTGGSLNELEAQGVVQELRRIVNTGYSGTIGVVSPFRAQANRIRDLVSQDTSLLESLMSRQFLVDTVHKFQGDERDIMIFSTVIGSDISKGSLLFLARTGNLFNVAITRARASLIIVGDMNACLNYNIGYFQKFVEYVKSLGDKSSIVSKEEKIDYGPKYPVITANVIVSEWEKIFYEALYKAGIITIPQYQVGQYILDLALKKNDRKLDIEIDGEKYHRSWDGELLKRDQLRNKRLIELGWDVKRFWVYQIRDDLSTCIKDIKTWLEK
ncbi:MAG: hypothetical protein SCALA702_00460 [Melioribacteraceae bacterium]|nr:MAG: hypothetical protein SCALA702_00460 [Melioribacteraceae bacterium]